LDCLFCRIVEKTLPANIVYESEEVLGFKDVRPQAPVHLLFIPKKHVSGVHEVTSAQADAVGPLVVAANHVARQEKISDSGFRLVINSKADGGQTVDHLHLHLMGGRKMAWPPG
jgi:histidine triad (HIT) family protein